MSETQAEIEAHNRATLWQDVRDHLDNAVASLRNAQGALEDLGELPFATRLDGLQAAVELARGHAQRVVKASTWESVSIETGQQIEPQPVTPEQAAGMLFSGLYADMSVGEFRSRYPLIEEATS